MSENLKNIQAIQEKLVEIEPQLSSYNKLLMRQVMIGKIVEYIILTLIFFIFISSVVYFLLKINVLTKIPKKENYVSEYKFT